MGTLRDCCLVLLGVGLGRVLGASLRPRAELARAHVAAAGRSRQILAAARAAYVSGAADAYRTACRAGTN